jgi:hypothetical protein
VTVNKKPSKEEQLHEIVKTFKQVATAAGEVVTAVANEVVKAVDTPQPQVSTPPAPKPQPVTTQPPKPQAPPVSTAPKPQPVTTTPPPLPAKPAKQYTGITYYQQQPMPALPRLYVTRHVLADMTAEVLAHPHIETAWGLYGFRYPKSVFLVGVIRPVAGEVVRGFANAEAGGLEMAKAYNWLKANEKEITKAVGSRRSGHGEFDFLYKGHSHHTLGFDHYSGTDQQSILSVVKDDGLKVAVGPLALIRANNVGYNHTTPWSHETTASRYTRVTFLFYMLTKEMVDAGYHEAVTVKPVIIDTANTLLVPPMAWEFSQTDDFNRQIRNLRNFGCTVEVRHVDVNRKPPLEIQFKVDHKKWKHILMITTDWNYPDVPPKIQLIPKSADITFKEANALSAETWWVRGDGFIDIVGKMIERGVLENGTVSN